MVLSDKSIKEELAKGRIKIDPLGESCIQPASVDVHLDKEILVFRNSVRPYVDIKENMQCFKFTYYAILWHENRTALICEINYRSREPLWVKKTWIQISRPNFTTSKLNLQRF